MQVLDRLASGRRGRRLEAVIVDRVPGRADFHGLGELEPEELADAVARPRGRSTPPSSRSAERAWAALRGARPDARLAALVREGTPDAAAARAGAASGCWRSCPRPDDGLARSERQLLRAVGAGARTPLDAFLADAEQEEARYAGDTIVFARLGAWPPASPAPRRPARRPARADARRRARPGRRGRREMGGEPMGDMPSKERGYGIANGGAIIHELGCVRMGTDAGSSALNGWSQAWKCRNLFVTDGGPFVSQCDKNPNVDHHGARVADRGLHCA